MQGSFWLPPNEIWPHFIGLPLGIKQNSCANARQFTKLLPLALARLRFNKSFRLLNKVPFNQW
jgi:hypothetical protein